MEQMLLVSDEKNGWQSDEKKKKWYSNHDEQMRERERERKRGMTYDAR